MRTNAMFPRAAAILALVLLECALAMPVRAQVLYWLDTNYGAPVLRRARADGTLLSSVALAPGSLPEGLALDASGRRLFITGAAWSGAQIVRSSADLLTLTTVLGGKSVLRGDAVDQTGGKLYWVSSNLVAGAKVERANLDGTAPTTVIALGSTNNLRGIAIDEAAQRLYYTDFDQNQVVRARLVGDSLKNVVLTGAGSSPYGIVFAPSSHLIYWAEYGSGLIRRAAADGSGVTTLFTGLSHPTGLALDATGGFLYWVEAGSAIRRGSIGGGVPVTISPTITTYGGIVFAPVAVTDIVETLPVTETSLSVPSPNPARDETTIAFALPTTSDVRLEIADVQGRQIARLVAGTTAAGRHTVSWDASRTPPGVYWVRMNALGREWRQRLTVLR